MLLLADCRQYALHVTSGKKLLPARQLHVCRCAVIPLVSKEFYRIHREYPPQRTSWLIEGEVSQPMITWFTRGAYRALEILEIREMDGFLGKGGLGYLSQLLALVAESLPGLRELRISNHLIDLDDMLKIFPDHSNKSSVQSLTGLQSLTVSMSVPANPFLFDTFR